MDSIAYSCCRKNPTLRKIRPSKLGLLTNKRRNKNYGSLPLGGSTPVSSSQKGPRSVTPSEVSAREDFGRRSPGLLPTATGGDGVAVMEAQETARKERIASLRPGILGTNQRRKRRMPFEMEEQTTTGRREFVRFREPVLEHDSVDLLLGPC